MIVDKKPKKKVHFSTPNKKSHLPNPTNPQKKSSCLPHKIKRSFPNKKSPLWPKVHLCLITQISCCYLFHVHSLPCSLAVVTRFCCNNYLLMTGIIKVFVALNHWVGVLAFTSYVSAPDGLIRTASRHGNEAMCICGTGGNSHPT